MFSSRFPKSRRLLKSYQYHFIRKHGNSWLGESIIIDSAKSKSPKTQLGITVSKRYGKAHERNHFKRLVREIFRRDQTVSLGWAINVRPKKGLTQPSYLALLKDWESFQRHLLQEKNRFS